MTVCSLEEMGPLKKSLRLNEVISVGPNLIGLVTLQREIRTRREILELHAQRGDRVGTR